MLNTERADTEDNNHGLRLSDLESPQGRRRFKITGMPQERLLDADFDVRNLTPQHERHNSSISFVNRTHESFAVISSPNRGMNRSFGNKLDLSFDSIRGHKHNSSQQFWESRNDSLDNTSFIKSIKKFQQRTKQSIKETE